MAIICPVCGEKIRFLDGDFSQEGIEVHTRCMGEFNKNPDKYGEKAKEKTENQVQVPSNSEPSDKDFITTLLICVFLGGLGVHRFFVDKMGTGVLMLVTLGGLGLWWIIDIILIVTGSLEDSEGKVIAYQAAGTVNREPAKDMPAEIEKLADLKDKGIITDEEFQQKKQELLDRI